LSEINIEATIENISVITNFVNDELDKYNCPEKEKIKVDIVIDELVTNVSKYAYGEETGMITVQIEMAENNICMAFIDSGIPYNPLERAEPDVTLSVDDRPIGGLGIYLVKKLMDDITYEYADGKNILKIKKYY